MPIVLQFIDLFLHLDVHLNAFIAEYGLWTYAVLIAIVFCETGLVVTPFLPGDSLLFAAGALAAAGSLEVKWLVLGLVSAAILGDTANYWIGRTLGPPIFGRWLNKAHLIRTQAFYEHHGGKTIIIARFLPIIRTFAPFVAGIGSMQYSRFVLYNVIGALLWVSIFVGGGYFFGTLPIVKENFTLVILGIIVVSLLPGMIQFLRHRFALDKLD